MVLKSVVQIAARVLSVYFIVLPVLFGMHAAQHEHQEHEDYQAAVEITLPSADCSLCDLYHGQTVLTEVQSSFTKILLHSPFKTHLFEVVVTTTLQTLCLRGPPFSYY